MYHVPFEGIVSLFFFLFIHNMALLQGLAAITTGVGVKIAKKSKDAYCPRSQKPRVLITTLAWFELPDVLPYSFSPDNGVGLGSISVLMHTLDIIFAVRSRKSVCRIYIYKGTFLATHTVLSIKVTTGKTRPWYIADFLAISESY